MTPRTQNCAKTTPKYTHVRPQEQVRKSQSTPEQQTQSALRDNIHLDAIAPAAPHIANRNTQTQNTMPQAQTLPSTTLKSLKNINSRHSPTATNSKTIDDTNSTTDSTTTTRPHTPNMINALKAETIGAPKSEVVAALLHQSPEASSEQSSLLNMVQQFLPWMTLPQEHTKTSHDNKTPALSTQDVLLQAEDILKTFKASRYDQAPKTIPGMLDALLHFKALNAHIIFCTNASAIKVCQEWSSIIQENWKTLADVHIRDEKTFAHIIHSPHTDDPAETMPDDWDHFWGSLASQFDTRHANTCASNLEQKLKSSTDVRPNSFRIDILGKCGKGKLPANYPKQMPKINLNPQNLAELGVTSEHPIYFVGNEIKDAAAARYLADRGFQVQFFFLNTDSLAAAIAHLAQHLQKMDTSHEDYETQRNLLKQCNSWGLGQWSNVQRITNGYELRDKISQTLQHEQKPQILMDFHGTISDQLRTLSDLVDQQSSSTETR